MKLIKLFVIDPGFHITGPSHWDTTLQVMKDTGGIAIYGSSQSVEDAIDSPGARDADVVVLDLDAWGDETSGLLQALSDAAGKDVPAIGLCRVVDETRLAFSVGAGVRACVDRDRPRDIVQAVVEVARGAVPIQRDIAGQPALLWNLASALRERLRETVGSPVESRSETKTRERGSGQLDCPISEREASILEMVADGFSYREISETLTIAERTVKNHMARSLEKLGARGRAHAVRMALQAGWICNGDGDGGLGAQVAA